MRIKKKEWFERRFPTFPALRNGFAPFHQEIIAAVVGPLPGSEISTALTPDGLYYKLVLPRRADDKHVAKAYKKLGSSITDGYRDRNEVSYLVIVVPEARINRWKKRVARMREDIPASQPPTSRQFLDIMLAARTNKK